MKIKVHKMHVYKSIYTLLSQYAYLCINCSRKKNISATGDIAS